MTETNSWLFLWQDNLEKGGKSNDICSEVMTCSLHYKKGRVKTTVNSISCLLFTKSTWTAPLEFSLFTKFFLSTKFKLISVLHERIHIHKISITYISVVCHSNCGFLGQNHMSILLHYELVPTSWWHPFFPLNEIT